MSHAEHAVAPPAHILAEAARLRTMLWDDPRVQEGLADTRWQADRGLERQARQLIITRATELFTADGQTITSSEQQHTVELAADDMVGFGPLELLIADEKVSEIMVNGAGAIFVERRGRLLRTDLAFEDDDHVLRVICRIAAACGKRLDASSPSVDGRLPDGSLIHAVIPPIAVSGPSLTLRKFGARKIDMASLVRFGSLTPEMAELLRACISSRCNILVAGNSGSGKTTLLNILTQFIPEDERIVAIEAARAGLHFEHDNVVILESQPASHEGGGATTVRDLVQMSAHMRPERVILAEVNGPEGYDILRLMDQGHDGTLMTIAAESPDRALERLILLIKLSYPDLPESYLRALVARTFHLVVQQSRLRDGSRRVVAIAEVFPAGSSDFELRNIWSYRQTGVREDGRVTGVFRPGVASLALKDRFEENGFYAPPSVLPVPFEELVKRSEEEQREVVAQEALERQTGATFLAQKRVQVSLWSKLLPGIIVQRLRAFIERPPFRGNRKKQ